MSCDTGNDQAMIGSRLHFQNLPSSRAWLPLVVAVGTQPSLQWHLKVEFFIFRAHWQEAAVGWSRISVSPGEGWASADATFPVPGQHLWSSHDDLPSMGWPWRIARWTVMNFYRVLWRMILWMSAILWRLRGSFITCEWYKLSTAWRLHCVLRSWPVGHACMYAKSFQSCPTFWDSVYGL